jgi:NAD-dependent dihydropyrimidine dehydrogenase PreA subunit
MIYVDKDRCTGCEACLRVCPEGAISLVEGRAFIDQELCSKCRACIEVCPQEAILMVEVIEPAAETMELSPTMPVDAPVPAYRRLLPAVGAAVLWTGLEILPRVAMLALDALERRIESAGSRPLTRGGLTTGREGRAGRGRQGAGRGAGRGGGRRQSRRYSRRQRNAQRGGGRQNRNRNLN